MTYSYLSIGSNPSLASLIISVIRLRYLITYRVSLHVAAVNCGGDYLVIMYIVELAVLHTVFGFLSYFSGCFYKSSSFKRTVIIFLLALATL
jgi:hypothetical protein